jgi:hypothetical protein
MAAEYRALGVKSGNRNAAQVEKSPGAMATYIATGAPGATEDDFVIALEIRSKRAEARVNQARH